MDHFPRRRQHAIHQDSVPGEELQPRLRQYISRYPFGRMQPGGFAI